jgi:Protein of unknown function (DUF1592)/Protein of unknown function (DUF1588)/Protein of unknown function (DUF1585)/Protein of unknown function (DUF1587)/Protein of unknown function (DUF1595)/Planctomycete cytochrome C
VAARGISVSLVAVSAVLLTGCEPSHEELVAEHSSVVRGYCLDCHNDVERIADLSLESLDMAAVAERPETWEKVVRKLRGGMMPPADGPRPDHDSYLALTEWLESELDAAHEPLPPPLGLHRMNRAEYANAIRDLLALEVDAKTFLPSDDSSRGFDNQAGTLGLSPALLEAYLTAAGKISRLAIGDVTTPTQTLYRVAEDTTQNYHVEGLPFGTRGGILIDHYFPVDGKYDVKIFSVNLGNMGNFRPFGEVRGEQLEVLVDGERAALFDWDKEFGMGRGFGFGNGQLRTIDLRLPMTAGPHKVGVTFLASNFAPLLDLNNAFERSTIETGGLPGFTFYPHIGRVRVDGPYEASESESSTPSRLKIFTCEPETDAQETDCARSILAELARRAYRGFATDDDIATLLEFYAQGRETGTFDSGIETALQRMLADPKFIYRIETQPADLPAGETYMLGDLELASRLSFFLWSSIPDDELLTLAEEGRLSDPAVLEAQVMRMLDDARSTALTENFAGQWLALRNLEGHAPVVDQFPDFDDNLRQAFRRETELFFDSILRENRSVLDLLTADYTFVNDRLAEHYGIPGIQGSRFRRVELAEEFDVRRGLLGKGSMLTVSSQPGRTAPVMRGSWILSTLIGIPPPDPPPDVPDLAPAAEDAAGNTRQPTIREQYEQHRQNPACQGCHKLMDPFGFALEPFDATGRLRVTDNGSPINSEDVMYDGTPVSGPSDVREFLLKYSDQFVRNLTENLLTYATGRGVEYHDMPVVRSIVREAEQDDYRFESLILEVVKSEPFRMSTVPGGNAAVVAQARD